MKNTPHARRVLEELRAMGKITPEKESETLDIIERMMKNRPKVEADPVFLARLRERLQNEALAFDQNQGHTGAFWANFAKFFSVPVAFAGIAAVASTLGIFELFPSESEIPSKTGGTVAFKSFPVDEGSDAASGIGNGVGNPKTGKAEPVAVRTDAEDPKTGGRNPQEPAARTFSSEPPAEDRSLEDLDAELNGIEGDGTPANGGLDGGAMGFLSVPAPEGSAMKASPTADMAIPSIRYSFSGELPPLPSKRTFRRIPATSVANVVGNGLSSFVDENSGDVSIVRNFETWPEGNAGKTNALTDFEIVSITESFTRHAGFDLSKHAKPSVERHGGSATVSYPVLFGGVGIFDESGYAKTSWFSVDLSDKRVSGGFFVNLNVSEASVGNRLAQEEVLNRLSTGPVSQENARTVEIRNVSGCYVSKYVENEGKLAETLVPGYRFEIGENSAGANPVAVGVE
jgi:hypothetical protein